MFNLKIMKLKERLKKQPIPGNYLMLSQEYMNSGKMDEAVTTLLNCIEKFPAYAGAHVALGRIYFDKRSIGDAIEEYEKAAVISPDNLMAHKKLAELYTMRGDEDMALGAYRRVLGLNPRDAAAADAVRRFDADGAAGKPPKENLPAGGDAIAGDDVTVFEGLSKLRPPSIMQEEVPESEFDDKSRPGFASVVEATDLAEGDSGSIGLADLKTRSMEGEKPFGALEELEAAQAVQADMTTFDTLEPGHARPPDARPGAAEADTDMPPEARERFSPSSDFGGTFAGDALEDEIKNLIAAGGDEILGGSPVDEVFDLLMADGGMDAQGVDALLMADGGMDVPGAAHDGGNGSGEGQSPETVPAEAVGDSKGGRAVVIDRLVRFMEALGAHCAMRRGLHADYDDGRDTKA